VTSALGYTGWAVLLVAGLVLWGLSHSLRWARGRAVARPSVVLTRLATGPWLRIFLVAGWMWAGWHLFAR
jgi:Family of unknown function (DUF6186)